MIENFGGFGLGLRSVHYESILADPPLLDCFEIVSEDFMVDGGAPLHYLERICELYPVVMHGVSLSIGGTDPVNPHYLEVLRDLIRRVNPLWVSDHLCWTGVDGINMHDLMPLPFAENVINHLVKRIAQVQDFLARPIVLENVSSYVNFKQSDMTEWEFVTEVAQRSGCYLLLDINNVYVNSFNHKFDPYDYINAIPKDKVKQFHLAGHKNCQSHIIDTHDSPIIEPVWELYRHAAQRFPDVLTIIERDEDIPPLGELIDELNFAREQLCVS